MKERTQIIYIIYFQLEQNTEKYEQYSVTLYEKQKHYNLLNNYTLCINIVYLYMIICELPRSIYCNWFAITSYSIALVPVPSPTLSNCL